MHVVPLVAVAREREEERVDVAVLEYGERRMLVRVPLDPARLGAIALRGIERLVCVEHRTHAHAADVESGAHNHAVGVWRANAGTALRVERSAVYAGDGQDVRVVRHAGVDRVAARV